MAGLQIKSAKQQKSIVASKSGMAFYGTKESKPTLGANLISKYFTSLPSYNNNKKHLNASHIWKSLLLGWELLKKGLKWNIGNSNIINFWHDNWLNLGPIRQLIQSPLTLHELDLNVSSVFTNGEWDSKSLIF